MKNTLELISQMISLGANKSHRYWQKAIVFWNSSNETSKPLTVILKKMAYKIYVRPLLKYSFSVWSPWQKKYIQQHEMIQHRAVRYVLNDYAYISNVTAMLSKLKLPTLETRRHMASLVMLYKIHNGHVCINLPSYIKASMRNNSQYPLQGSTPTSILFFFS